MNKNYKFIGTVDVKKIKNKLFCISVLNTSNYDRIHLIIDYLKGNIL